MINIMIKKAILTMVLAFCCAAGHSQNDLSLHYDRPATFFEESLVIGNGRLGGIVYGGTTTDRISLNDITLWTGEPDRESVNPKAYTHLPKIREALFNEDYETADSLAGLLQGHESDKYQPLGNLYIDYLDDAAVTDYSRCLSLNTAIAMTHCRRDGVAFAAEYFASAPDSVIVIRLKSESKSGIRVRIRLETEQPHQLSAKGNRIENFGYVAYIANTFYHTGEHAERFLYDENRGIHFCTIVDVKNKGGEVVAENGTLLIDGCEEVVLTIANETSFNGPDKDPVKEGRDYTAAVQRIVDRAARKSFTQLKIDHESDYQQFFNRVTLDLGETAEHIRILPTDQQLLRYTDNNENNPELEVLYFQYGRYLLISCSRTQGVPANLQGLWNEYMSAPWRSNYTTNINLEENYWPAETTNLSEMHAPLLSFIQNMQRTGLQTAKTFFGVDEGWCSGHNSDIWAMTSPVGEGIGGRMWSNWNMGGAWLSTHIWEHYQFSRDIDFLRDYYPALKGAAAFCLGWLIEKDGELITAPSTSPENEYVTDEGFRGSFFYGGSADLAIIRECVGDAVKAAEVLGVDEGFRAEATGKLARLRPYKIGRRGNLLEWYHDWDDADWEHRHQSHLIGLYPGHHISPATTPELTIASAQALKIKGDRTTGWSTGWRINLLARLLDAEGAYHMYRTLLRYVSPDKYQGDDARRGGGTYPNLLDAHSPFQIDGNFGGSAGVAEMLMQSDDETITLLPACPKQWDTGHVSGLCARGGFVIDFAWEDGKVTTATITARHAGNTTVFINGVKHYVSIGEGEKATIL